MQYLAILHTCWPHGGKFCVATLNGDAAFGSPTTAWVMQQIYSHLNSQGGTCCVADVALIPLSGPPSRHGFSTYLNLNLNKSPRDSRGYSVTLYSIPTLCIAKISRVM